MAKQTVHATAHYAWWWPMYKAGIVGMVWLTGMAPDIAKVQAVHDRAATIRFVR